MTGIKKNLPVLIEKNKQQKNNQIINQNEDKKKLIQFLKLKKSISRIQRNEINEDTLFVDLIALVVRSI